MRKLPFPQSAQAAIQNILASQHCALFVDRNIYKLYELPFSGVPILQLPSGERIKTFSWTKKILSAAARINLDRSSCLIAIGGGALCDAVGFAGSLYMRGIDTVLVPTTLLSQVDAAYGGKTGINFLGIKNLVGTFHNPKQVIADPLFLVTLSDREYCSGLGEVLKYAIGFDAALFALLEDQHIYIINRDKTILDNIIKTCASIKTSIVQHDQFEYRKRKLLNLGHTFGHAFEQLLHIPHGHAVMLGMLATAKISKKLKILSEEDFNKISQLANLYGYRTKLPVFPAKITRFIEHDKKHYSDTIDFIVLEGIGKASILPLQIQQLAELLYE